MSSKNKSTELREQVTPEVLFYSRRKFLRLSALFGTAYALAACGVKPTVEPGEFITPTSGVGENDISNPYEEIANYNNYYEFTYEKADVARLAKDLKTKPWPIEIGGLVDNPMTIKADELIERYPAEERIYRMRCVEGWSMVIPWYGFPLHQLLVDLKVKPEAKYIAFTTLLDPEQMPNQASGYFFDWPYVEGLRLDEAMHDLTLLASGVYQKPLPPQMGAPLRLVVPWKYGFKSIKSIVKIELVEEQPLTFWSSSNPSEYGFYSNVNPDVPHLRWSQSTERRIGETQRRPTQLFNGYSEVAQLYEGMNLVDNF